MIKECELTPCSRVLLEKLTGRQLVKKFPAFYGTRRFITALTRARPRLCIVFRNIVFFYGEELLAPRPTPKLEDHPCRLSATAYLQLPSIFGGRSSIRNPRTRHAVVTGIHWTWRFITTRILICECPEIVHSFSQLCSPSFNNAHHVLTSVLHRYQSFIQLSW
jgi:hypothetical protein